MILAGILLLVIIFGPSFWTKRVLRKYNYCRNDIPGTGGDFANHLLKQLNLKNFNIKSGKGNDIDHYDPRTKTITLSANYYESNSLTAIVIAAHEIGHAVQDANQSKTLHLRTKLVKVSTQFEKLASLLLVSAPLITLLFKIPLVGASALLMAIAVMGLPILVHLITLPLEYDASFNKAMPILKARVY
jgi:Predicted Zn-dependent protease